jgi:hypothetical protein
MLKAETPKEAFRLMMVNYVWMDRSQLIMALEILHSRWKDFENKADDTTGWHLPNQGIV